MTENPKLNELLEILKGILVLSLCHMVLSAIIFALGFIVGSVLANYTFIVIWVIGAAGFLFWQLLYVIPLVIWLKRKGHTGMLKGVIIGGVITALLNGACSLAFFG